MKAHLAFLCNGRCQWCKNYWDCSKTKRLLAKILRCKDWRSDSIKMEKGSTTVTASSSSVDVTSPNLNIKGNTKVNGNISVTGNVTISGTLTLGGIVMNTHTHVGVHGPTGGPV